MIKLAEVNDQPCPGDPVPYPVIAEQKVSGIEGGMFGCTRNGDGCTEGTTNNPGKKPHKGIDLVNEYGMPVSAMYGGTVYWVGEGKDAGHYVLIRSTVNGQTFITEYFHLQDNDRVTTGQSILAGQVIGYQGNSGNLKEAIERGYTTSHVHIKVKKHQGGNTSDYLNYKEVDPRNYLNTTITNEGKTIKESDC